MFFFVMLALHLIQVEERQQCDEINVRVLDAEWQGVSTSTIEIFAYWHLLERFRENIFEKPLQMRVIANNSQ